jgi:para-nitrobenzyl esterase
MNKKTSTKKGLGIARRGWMRTAAALMGGTAASSVLPGVQNRAAAATLVRTGVSASPQSLIVETTAGKIHGFSRDGIMAFKGVPYGGDTAGKNRFMPPAKPAPWAGVRSAMALGPCSPQPYNCTVSGRRGGWNNDEEAFMFEWDDGIASEDCLRINVWTPSINDNRKRPVMVWIHGGGFQSGSSNELRMYDGESLSRRGDVVVVSMNHRLGALGYLSLLDYGEKWASAANVGNLDLVAALEWIHDNIGNFGGDPGRVLIFGQSGGGSKVGTLMAMPSSKGLFHRGVIQSGSGLRQATPDRAGQLTAAVLAELGLNRSTLDQIQQQPYERLVMAGMEAQRKLRNRLAPAPGGGGGNIGWGPVVDGKILPKHAWDPKAPEYSAGVPLMVGTVLHEFTNSVQQGDPKLDQMTMEEMERRVSATRGDKTERIVEVFRKAHPSVSPYELLARITNAGGGRQNAITQAERKAAQGGAPAYLYWFQWKTPILDGRPGAFHCSELPFCFFNTDRCSAMTGGGADARALAGKIADAWISFARNGNPNHAGVPKWDAFSAEKCPTMIFDNICVAKNNPDLEERRAL